MDGGAGLVALGAAVEMLSRSLGVMVRFGVVVAGGDGFVDSSPQAEPAVPKQMADSPIEQNNKSFQFRVRAARHIRGLREKKVDRNKVDANFRAMARKLIVRKSETNWPAPRHLRAPLPPAVSAACHFTEGLRIT